MTQFIKIALLLTLLPTVSLYADEKTGLIPCAMIPHWSPQAQFAGYYVAREKGIYQKHGIDMVILTGGPERPATEYLKDGRADFAVMWLTTAIRQFDQGVRPVHLGQVIPRSSMMLVAKKSRHIRTPADMNGKKVGLWGGDFAIPPRAFFMKYGLEVKEVPQSGTVNLFLRGGVDVASAMWYNEYHTILNAGIDPEELDLFPLFEYGLNFPEDGLYMRESAYRNNPALADAFVKASFEGWDYAFSHPDDAVEITISYMREAGIPANRIHQKWMLSKMRDLIFPADEKRASRKLNETDFDAVADFLLHAGLIGEMPDYRQFTGEIHDKD